MTTTAAAWLSAFVLCCCSAQKGPDTLPAPQGDNGQTGSPSYSCTEAACAATAQRLVVSLTQSLTPPVFVAASCHPPDHGLAQLDTRPTIFCRCDQKDGGYYLLSDVSLGPGCEVRGRGGLCIFDDSDFSGCDPADAHSCDSTCSLLQSRLASDAANTSSPTVRFSGCVAPPPDSVLYTQPRCGIVLHVNDQCYTDAFQAVLESEPVDCALSDQEILSRAFGGVDSGAAGASSGAGP